MPEASVHKDQLPSPRKDDVGAAGQIAHVNSVAVACLVERGAQGFFGSRIFPTNPRHQRAASIGRKPVHAGDLITRRRLTSGLSLRELADSD
jgi:hypothetical protein